MNAGYSIAIIEPTDRENYYNALANADKGDYQAITRLLKDSVQRSIERELQVIYPQWQKDYPKLAYEVAKKKEIAEKKREISLNKEQEKMCIRDSSNTVKPEIISIVLSKTDVGTDGQANNIATARVRLIQRNLSSGQETAKNIVVSLTYEYLPVKNMVEGFRMDNPLGFIVTHYRVDNEA